ncbi:tRNA-(MS[2]IO[6]A)-hydroxylase MiaE-like protein [Branchiibius hedensis]|uniref:tRNA-(MS[2]IO[6]A)-hydroxylase (MiaE)-like n=1 Tax=Branchiibius hedensis TaxID=672460 RepID=A0A2Y8ZMI4_9MICO|nr:ferritin-like fold-containing protein [Branchiibius hedensis]PWJ24328.1 tRNA-(MS[2]IO[6]A)-hydroxylase MiaE-like protein [Branchiibius hedensis]SSA33145.1 tRNA-(MS[2]IO[6]A)-hydroxylase (MiaE)-like [Branchiibius hedensis]
MIEHSGTVTSTGTTSAPEAGVTSLLGVLAYGELMAFFDVARVAEMAPTVPSQQALGALAAREYSVFEQLSARLRELGADPAEAMQPFHEPFDNWHARITPADWHEGLMKIYAGSAIATDFYRELTDVLDPATADMIRRALPDDEQAAIARTALLEAIAQDERLAGRLALLGRRMMGEALSQAQLVALINDDLLDLIMDRGTGQGFDLVGFQQLLTRLGEKHTRRMAALGLDA